MLKDFCAKLFITDNDKYSADDININENEDNNEQNNLNKTDPNDKIILEGIEPFIMKLIISNLLIILKIMNLLRAIKLKVIIKIKIKKEKLKK